jgi:hypothetical protein
MLFLVCVFVIVPIFVIVFYYWSFFGRLWKILHDVQEYLLLKGTTCTAQCFAVFWRHEKWNILNVIVISCFQFSNMVFFVFCNFYCRYHCLSNLNMYRDLYTDFNYFCVLNSRYLRTKCFRGSQILFNWYSNSRSDLICRSHSELLGPGVIPNTGLLDSPGTMERLSHSGFRGTLFKRNSVVPESHGPRVCRSNSEIRVAGFT